MKQTDEIFFEREIEEPNVVEEFGEMGFAGEISDDVKGSEEDITSCEGSETEEDKNRKKIHVSSKRARKFKQFNKEVDMKNPSFVIGMQFPDSNTLKKAVREYSIVIKKKIWIQLNRADKVQAKCGWSRRSNKRTRRTKKEE
ncbi:hypothetical protein M0R45_007016 [Rubus argutus]|uniref:Transposase MuDR plant domain-containing protein n=1 Tax=Rubus argutus TaxID=59490 RepID=A0AAW1YSN0_RUBAR